MRYIYRPEIGTACAQIVLVGVPPRIGENSSEAPITIESECDYRLCTAYTYTHIHTQSVPRPELVTGQVFRQVPELVIGITRIYV